MKWPLYIFNLNQFEIYNYIVYNYYDFINLSLILN